MEQNHLLESPVRERSPENTVVLLFRTGIDGREGLFRCFKLIPDAPSITCKGQRFVKMRTVVYGEYRYRCVDCGQVYISKEKLEPVNGTI